MLSTLLVPLDGSPLAERALPYAEALARLGEGRVILVRAVEGNEHAAPDARQSAALADAEQYLRGVGDALVTSGVEVDIATPYGDIVQQIVAESEARNASLIVMGTHGRDGLARFFSGSVAEEVLQQTTRPMMLIRTGEESSAETFPPHPRILVPLDGSLFAETALQLAHDLARLLDGELLLLSVITPPPPLAMGAMTFGAPPYVDFDLDGAQRESQAYLERIGRQYGIDQALIQANVQIGGTTEGIVESISQLGASLVVMATHARSSLSRLFFGSTATDTLHKITVPLVLLHVDDDPELATSEQSSESVPAISTGLTVA